MKFLALTVALVAATSATKLSREYMGDSLGLSNEQTYSTGEQADHQKEIEAAEKQAELNQIHKVEEAKKRLAELENKKKEMTLAE